MISFLEVINYQKSNFVDKKNGLLPFKKISVKRDSESKREWKEIVALHLKRVFTGTATNFSDNAFFAGCCVTCHVCLQKYQFYFKMFRTLKTELCAISGSIAMITFRNIANKLFLPVKAFDSRSRLFPYYRFSGSSSQMFTDEAFWFGAVIHKRLIL